MIQIIHNINLGCGERKLKGFLNVDIIGDPDLRHDLNEFPYPFSDGSIKHIRMDYVLEHLKPYPDVILKELHRILRDGGDIYIRVPHFSNPNSLLTQHKHIFGACSFLAYNKDDKRNKWFDFGFSEVDISLKFCRGLLAPIMWFIESIANTAPHFYELYLAKFFHAEYLEVRLYK